VPIYEYVCESCGRLTERMQKMSDPPPARCPECGAGPLARLVSRTTFQLRGGGWYSDLYSSPKKKTAPGAEGKAEGKTDGKAGEKGSAGDGGSTGAAERKGGPSGD
jgi:putative FmdB family regulatory protein